MPGLLYQLARCGGGGSGRRPARPLRAAVPGWLHLALVLVGPAVAAGPPTGEGSMLMAEIAGNRYEREAFGPGGELTGRALIEVGELRSRDAAAELTLSVVAYEPTGEVAKRLESVWRCRPGHEQMVMPLLVLQEEARRELRLRVSGDPILYPAPPLPEELPDLVLEIAVEKGFLAFIGGRTVVRVSDRWVGASPAGEPEDRYAIRSELEVKAYALGIRFKRRRFRSEELVDPVHGLVRHVLETEDGGRAVLRFLPPPEERVAVGAAPGRGLPAGRRGARGGPPPAARHSHRQGEGGFLVERQPRS